MSDWIDDHPWLILPFVLLVTAIGGTIGGLIGVWLFGS